MVCVLIVLLHGGPVPGHEKPVIVLWILIPALTKQILVHQSSEWWFRGDGEVRVNG